MIRGDTIAVLGEVDETIDEGFDLSKVKAFPLKAF